MQFRILSHAGLAVEGAGKTLLFDPWLVGSVYWRSWWNYPPADRAHWEDLRPDFIYLTHIHWDHFHGPSLRKFPRATVILVPRDPNPRLRGDLVDMGFTDVREIPHGGTVELAPGFSLTSWHFFPVTDSAAVVSCEGVTFLNANDAKFMGGPLRQILARHPPIDFVFRSHSSANSRLCYEFMDEPGRPWDDPTGYLRDFAAFVRATGARYAIPFASNHCFLHREVLPLNASVITPTQVADYCRRRGIRSPQVRVMVAGDSWSTDRGFQVSGTDWFADREARLEAYARAQAPALEKSYALEARADVTLEQVAGYFRRFIAALPWAARLLYRGKPLAIRTTGLRNRIFVIELYRGRVSEAVLLEDDSHPLQIHASAHILRRCMALDLFLYMGISKRVRYRCRRGDRRLLLLLEYLFTLYESGWFPLSRLLSYRFLRAWPPRWRELLLYARILLGRALGRPFRMEDHLPPREGPGASMVVRELAADAAGPVELLQDQHPGPFMGQGHAAQGQAFRDPGLEGRVHPVRGSDHHGQPLP